MPARRSNRAVASMAAWVAVMCGLALGSAACTDGTTADCSDAQCQVVVEVIDTGASAESGVDADASADEDSSAGPDSSADAGADSRAGADAADGARE